MPSASIENEIDRCEDKSVESAMLTQRFFMRRLRRTCSRLTTFYFEEWILHRDLGDAGVEAPQTSSCDCSGSEGATARSAISRDTAALDFTLLWEGGA